MTFLLVMKKGRNPRNRGFLPFLAEYIILRISLLPRWSSLKEKKYLPEVELQIG